MERGFSAWDTTRSRAVQVLALVKVVGAPSGFDTIEGPALPSPFPAHPHTSFFYACLLLVSEHSQATSVAQVPLTSAKCRMMIAAGWMSPVLYWEAAARGKSGNQGQLGSFEGEKVKKAAR